MSRKKRAKKESLGIESWTPTFCGRAEEDETKKETINNQRCRGKKVLKKVKNVYLKEVRKGKKWRPLLESFNLSNEYKGKGTSWEWEEWGRIWGLKKKKYLGH